jgi:exopolyphosphatase/guanosine-5'-triphosphate,3'-diphosphate pyrophosphatase
VTGVTPGSAVAAVSAQMGSVRLTERHIAGDRPSPSELDALEHAVDEVLGEVEAAVPMRDARTLISVAGTATTLKAISLGLGRYDPEVIHRTWLSLEEVDRILVDLALMTNAERAALPVMAPGRGDVIVAGAVVLSRTMGRFGFERTLVSETDILDGLAFELLGIG